MTDKAVQQLKEGIKWLNESDSVLADIIWLILIYIFIRYLLFPGLGLLLGTNYPVVAIVSTSMEHHGSLNQWWNSKACSYCLPQREWYLEHNISFDEFNKFPFKNGLDKGDVMILKGEKPQNIKVGQILVFKTPAGIAVIHRVVKKWKEDGKYYFQTKGDANPISGNSPEILETRISQDRVIGVAVARIPWLGWIKIIINDTFSFLFHIRAA